MSEPILRAVPDPLPGFDLEVRFGPDWNLIDEVCRFCERFCEISSLSRDRAAQLAIAIHELVQNAVQHSNGEPVELTLHLDPEARRVVLSFSNSATPEQANTLASKLEALRLQEDALQAYLQLLASSPHDTPGGIGLARVRCEAQLELASSYDGERIVIQASGDTEPRALGDSNEVGNA